MQKTSYFDYAKDRNLSQSTCNVKLARMPTSFVIVVVWILLSCQILDSLAKKRENLAIVGTTLNPEFERQAGKGACFKIKPRIAFF